MKSRHLRMLRYPRTTAEKRANCEREYRKYIRGKRLPCNLPDAYDDMFHCVQNTWKVKRRTQYRCGGRGERHSVSFKSSAIHSYRFNCTKYDLEAYFKDHDIPYDIEEHRERYTYYLPVYASRISGEGDYWEWETYFTGEFRTGKSWRTTGYTLTWWSDKDIGVKYIMESVGLEVGV